MNRRLLHTIIHLRPTQIIYQLRRKIIKPRFKILSFKGFENINENIKPLKQKTSPIPKPRCIEGDTFTFLNIASPFTKWDDTSRGMLWAYNLNYFDFINQSDGAWWIDKFIKELSTNSIGLDAYPTALRGINWIKFFSEHPEAITRERTDSLYSQYKLLQRQLEYHLLGNHLLEDFYSLFIMSLFFGDTKYHKQITKRLTHELDEEILDDGGHYEQSIMYHCILSDRLLDCINYADNEAVTLQNYAKRMLGFLQAACFPDGSYPLFNDAALGIAPTPAELFDYGRRLGITWSDATLSQSGYRMMRSGRMEAMVDIGNITATYQPGHTHADTFTYELRIDGRPIVVDTGISTYNKTPRRQYERSTVAHNTVTVGDKDSSEVWGGFRVGKRAKVAGNICKTAGGDTHKRTFKIDETGFYVTDEADAPAISRIHLAPEVKVLESKSDGVATKIITSRGTITINQASTVQITDCQISREYNRLLDAKCIEIPFRGTMSYKIGPN